MAFNLCIKRTTQANKKKLDRSYINFSIKDRFFYEQLSNVFFFF